VNDSSASIDRKYTRVFLGDFVTLILNFVEKPNDFERDAVRYWRKNCECTRKLTRSKVKVDNRDGWTVDIAIGDYFSVAKWCGETGRARKGRRSIINELLFVAIGTKDNTLTDIYAIARALFVPLSFRLGEIRLQKQIISRLFIDLTHNAEPTRPTQLLSKLRYYIFMCVRFKYIVVVE